MADWHSLILAAQAAGYETFEDEGVWYIRTPKRPYRASETLGSYPDQRAAWRGAAHLQWLYTREHSDNPGPTPEHSGNLGPTRERDSPDVSDG